jgi:hypothetical protein
VPVRSALLAARLVVIFIVGKAFELKLLRIPDSMIDSGIAVCSSIHVRRLGIRLRTLESMDSVEMDEKVGDCETMLVKCSVLGRMTLQRNMRKAMLNRMRT